MYLTQLDQRQQIGRRAGKVQFLKNRGVNNLERFSFALSNDADLCSCQSSNNVAKRLDENHFKTVKH